MIDDYDFINKTIRNHNLKAATRREMPLFAISCISHGYTELLRKNIGLSYEVLGAIGGDSWFHTILNEEKIVKDTSTLIEREKNSLKENIFQPTIKNFNSFRKKFIEIKPLVEKDPVLFLKKFTPLYPEYVSSLGVYNCFWRYFGNSTGKMSRDEFEQIGKERDQIAKLYLETESAFKIATKKIGELNNFDGDLLRYLTCPEMNKYVLDKIKIIKKIEELKSRRQNYFYLFIEKPLTEKVFTNNVLVTQIREEFFQFKGEIKELKGFSAFKGKVKGKVLNLLSHYDRSKLNPEGSILVTSMTHPDDISLIKKSAAIVTDEGGILSHAAITAREMKKPCVIGTKFATQVLKNGDLVEVDADKGIVRIIKEEDESSKVLTRFGSRMYTMTLLDAFYDILTKIKEKVGCTTYPLFKYRKDKNTVEGYYDLKELHELFKSIGQYACDKNNFNFKKIVKDFGDAFKEIKPFLDGKKVKKDELESVYKSFVRFYLGVAYMWVLPNLEKVPYGLRKKALDLREKTEQYSGKRDHLFLRILSELYPEIDEKALFFSVKEAMSLDNKELAKLANERADGYLYYDRKVILPKDIDSFLQKRNISLEIENNYNSQDKTIKGTTAYKGKVKGTVKIVNNENDLSKIDGSNDILVSSMTRPEFISAMGKAIAFVTDEGGVTCHAAIVAREMKKPCVIGTKNASDVLKDGDMVEVDADKGIIKKLS